MSNNVSQQPSPQVAPAVQSKPVITTANTVQQNIPPNQEFGDDLTYEESVTSLKSAIKYLAGIGVISVVIYLLTRILSAL